MEHQEVTYRVADDNSQLPEGTPIPEAPPARAKGKQGFASMDPEKVREIASRGGKSAHKKGKAYTWSKATARSAGRKGGRSSHAMGKAHRFTTEQAREAGRKGGLANKARIERLKAEAQQQQQAG